MPRKIWGNYLVFMKRESWAERREKPRSRSTVIPLIWSHLDCQPKNVFSSSRVKRDDYFLVWTVANDINSNFSKNNYSHLWFQTAIEQMCLRSFNVAQSKWSEIQFEHLPKRIWSTSQLRRPGRNRMRDCYWAFSQFKAQWVHWHLTLT